MSFEKENKASNFFQVIYLSKVGVFMVSIISNTLPKYYLMIIVTFIFPFAVTKALIITVITSL